jgi:hypothetical protein
MKRSTLVFRALFTVSRIGIAVILLLVAFAGRASGQLDLTVNMTDFAAAHEGQLFKLRVVNSATGVEVGEYENEEITVPNFTAFFNNILKSGESYNIDAFADYNNNKLYDPPPVDHAWRIVITNVIVNKTVTLRHTPQWVDIEYPNQEPEPEPADTCDCDLNGDGIADTGDLLEWITQVRGGMENTCLDYDRDGEIKINDLIMLMLEIRSGGCLQP